MKPTTLLSLLTAACASAIVFAGQPSAPAVNNPRITCDRWPSSYDAKSWANDVWRIEKAQSDEEKAIAIYNWVRLQLHWGDQCFDGTRGTCVVECDAIKKINIYPYGFCVDFGITSAALAHAGGMKALEAHVPAHTELEVAYKDKDGIERSHRFDPFWGVTVYDKTGSHIATWEEIKADPGVARTPSKTLLPWGDKVGDRERFADKGACKPDLRVRPSKYTMDKALLPGETYTLSWDAQEKVRFCNSNPELKDNMNIWGWIRFQYTAGKMEGLKYGHELLRPYLTQEGDKLMVKPAHGKLDFAPLLDKTFEESLYQPSQNVAVGGAGEAKLRPDKPGAPAVLIYVVRTPYVIADAQVNAAFRASKDDSIKVSLASADWRQRDYTLDQVLPANAVFKTIWESKGDGPQTMELKIADLNLRGEYQYLVKIEMQAAKDPKKVGIDTLAFNTVFQENPMVLPRLLPGKNTINVTAAEIRAGYQLRVTYGWDDTKAKDQKVVKLTDKVPFSFEIEAVGQQAADVRSRFVSLEAIRK